MVAKIPREITKTKDITGGLPRVAELFEARKPKEFAIVSEIDGTVSFGTDVRGKRRVLVTPDGGEPREYLIPKGKHIARPRGRPRRAPARPLMDGSSNPHDILRIKGVKELAKYLVDEVQEVYRLQGVKINDKHIEMIVRQMLRRVRIKDPGDTDYLVGEQVDKWLFLEANEKVLAQGGRPAQEEPLLLGITKASLSTESFISAASFQETTKVLTEAGHLGQDRSSPRPQGERDHGSARPGGYRDGPLQEHRNPGRGARGRAARRRRDTVAAERAREHHLGESRRAPCRPREGPSRSDLRPATPGPSGDCDRASRSHSDRAAGPLTKRLTAHPRPLPCGRFRL